MGWMDLIYENNNQSDFIIESYQYLFQHMQSIVEDELTDNEFVVSLFFEAFASNAYMQKLYEEHFIESVNYKEPEWKTVMRFMRRVIETIKKQSETMKSINKDEVKRVLQQEKTGE